MISLRSVFFCVLFILFLGLLPANAQQVAGVSGVVSDKTGGVLAGVQVDLDNASLGFHATTTTNEIGSYQFLQLKPADGYQLTFSLKGFRKLDIRNITLAATITETRNAVLELGNVAESIEVTASGEATLNTTDASIGSVIDSRQVASLPIQNRIDAANLMTLQAGVNDAGSITGARTDQGNITLDGLDINDQATGQAFTSTIPVSIDALQEVRTVTAGETADYGRSSGGMINLETKAGSNDWHGNLSEYNRNTLSAANNWFNNRDHIARPNLVRNQFGGSLGGPVKKDKLFFFFNYDGIRVARGVQTTRTIPMATLRQGQLGYVNNTMNPATGQPCDGTATLLNAPTCISFIPATAAAGMTSVTSLDPCSNPPPGTCVGVTPGPDAALLQLFASRYPATGNDTSIGDGINTTGLVFTAPAHESDNVYTTRFDYTISDKHKLFLRGTVAREGVDDFFNTSIEQFPGDAHPVQRDEFNGYTFALGWSWTVSSRMTNQLTAGLTRAILNFPSLLAPTFPNDFIFPVTSSPFHGFASQSRNVPVPQLRDALTITRGKHTFDVGTDVKFTRQISALKNDFNFYVLGLGGNIFNLSPSLRPSDISTDPSAITTWDNIFPFLLGRYSEIVTNFNYNKSENVLAPGTGKSRDFNYNEFEFYGQDSWKLRSDLTMTYGLRYVLHTVPYEVNGFESVPSINMNAYFSQRLALAAAGTSGINALPFVSYSLGGAANNNSKGYYRPDHKDFGPRLAFAYNPPFRQGLLGSVFGDRKSTLRAGASILYDRIAGGASFGLDQNTFLFDTQVTEPFGTPRAPRTSLRNDPRFTGFSTAPAPPTAPVITQPNTPNVDNTGTPFGLANGGFPSFFQFDANTRNPYSILLNFGVQRELPGNFLLEVNYVGRLGRRLLAVGDAATITNFKDNTSGQFLRPAFGQVQQELPAFLSGQASSMAPVPWFENQMGGTAFCASVFGFAGATNCTEVVGIFLSQLVSKGDLSDTVQQLFAAGLLDFNVGLPAQTGANGYIGNYAASTYHSMQTILRKRFSNNLQFDFNYTYSHSIDNVSDIANNYIMFTSSGNGLVCDLENLRTCRASSDFDARHTISGNYIYDLPVGRGQRLLSDAPRYVDYIVGGWEWSGILSWRTGYPFTISTGAFPTAFTLDGPAELIGSASNLRGGIHTDKNGKLQYFSNPAAALAALGFTQAGAIGNRNVATGPGFFNFDMGVAKSFKMPWSEKQQLRFRWDSFNTLNHPSFSGPSSATLSNTSQFGIITSTASAPRVMQYSLRYEF
jgi:hypothetical protein